MMMKEDVHLDVASTDGAADLKSAPSPEDSTSPPDLSLMKLASSSSPPDMDTLIIQTVPTGPASLQGGSSLSSQLLYQHHRTLTEEQEFAEGFVKALEDLHKQNQLNLQLQPGPVPHCSVDSSPVAAVLPDLPPVYTSLTSYATSSPLVDSMVPLPPLPPPHHHHHHHHHHHPTTKMDEPQTVPDVQSLCGDASSPPPSPANGGEVTQDRIKAERKRLRNRIAATKCRKRKLERISRLEDKVQNLKEQNTDLSSTAGVLRQQVERLKQKVLNHVDSGCQVTVH